MPNEIEKKNDENLPTIQEDPIQQFITTILNNDTVKSLVESFAKNEQIVKKIESEDKQTFLKFLKTMDIRQKGYNIAFIIICSLIIYFLKNQSVIGQETSQTLITIVISMGFTDFIRMFRRKSNSDE